MGPVSEDHACAWRDEAEALRDQVATLQAQLEKLSRHVFGRRSEKVTPISEELRKRKPRTREETAEERRAKREQRKELPTETIVHKVPAEQRRCPKCGGEKFKPLGEGKQTVMYEYVPARLVRQVHVQETLACTCGECIITAPGEPKAIEQGQYGPGFIAHVAVAKCADSIPFYRQAKAFQRAGVPVARTTIGDLFHACARAAMPLSKRLLELIVQDELVRADETTMRVLDGAKKGETRRAWLWTFRTDKLIAYKFSASRSGEVPSEVLGESQGYLQVDAYTGYNAVTAPTRRVRVGCWSHARRKFYDALSTAPAAAEFIELVIGLYVVEDEAKAQGILGTAAHLALRKARSAPLIEQIEKWLQAQQPKHLPKSPLGEAIRYAKNQWESLTRFLDDPRIKLDNNGSEQALRVAALGRKNYLFVGNDEAGENIAGLYSLVATCEANDVNPEAYLADVLTRLATHPNSDLDELLPHKWKPLVPDSC
ncbi:MAG TPA: IS66 family transposase [Usitatibacter sp.]|nr:IS66 family transposase [Usitatibacter sp.]